MLNTCSLLMNQIQKLISRDSLHNGCLLPFARNLPQLLQGCEIIVPRFGVRRKTSWWCLENHFCHTPESSQQRVSKKHDCVSNHQTLELPLHWEAFGERKKRVVLLRNP